MRFPWRPLLIVAALVAACPLLAACGGEKEEAATPTPSPVPSATTTPTPTMTPTPSVTPAAGRGREWELPPSAVLRAGDARQTAALGSFCWTSGCADAVGIIVPTEPLAVAAGEPLVFEFGFDPTEVYVAVWRADQGEAVWDTSHDVFAWQPAGSEESVLKETPPPSQTMELRPDLPPGTYVVDVFARAAGGSAAYGFQLEIVP